MTDKLTEALSDIFNNPDLAEKSKQINEMSNKLLNQTEKLINQQGDEPSTLMLLLTELQQSHWQQKIELERIEKTIERIGEVFLRIEKSISSIASHDVVSVGLETNRDNIPSLRTLTDWAKLNEQLSRLNKGDSDD